MPIRLLALSLVLALGACVDPGLHAGISITPSGARVTPVLSTGLEGGGRISISP
ncbi:hypothetical protein [Pseudogemmobacter sonorensis]|uniref:hypothetical protein n=1 Tax=Pseudogemmobacter sonorensis TaxID=2989681 RepID=UPI0036AFD476